MTHRCRKKLKKPALEFLMILNQLVPFLKKTWKKSWKNLKKSFVIILQPSQFSILFFQKSKIPLKLCLNTKNHGFNPTRSDCNWSWHLMKLSWSHGRPNFDPKNIRFLHEKNSRFVSCRFVSCISCRLFDFTHEWRPCSKY